MNYKPQFARRARRMLERLSMRRGRIAQAEPLCPKFGYSRGQPIDRHYIHAFLAATAADIRGRVLEIGDDGYSKRFGGDQVEIQDVLHLRPGHPGATIVGDLCDPTVLPSATFDCIVLTQTLHLIFDLAGAVAQLHRSLRPGGVLLITVPGITSIDRGEWQDSWYWSLTGPALKLLLSGPFESEKVRCSVHGNLAAATAFLHGAAVEDLNRAALDADDAAFPVTVAARAVA